MTFLIKGLLIGMIFGIPAGAIGALTIQRAIDDGFMAGFVTGLGSSMADVIYSLVGVFGNAVISVFLTEYMGIVQCIGGVIIIILGIMIMLKKRVDVKDAPKKNLWFCFFSSFGTAMMNPAMILTFMVAFSTFGIHAGLPIMAGVALLFGILFGTLLWWVGLSGLVAVFRNRITDKIYRWLNWILGSGLLVFGAGMIVKAAFTH